MPAFPCNDMPTMTSGIPSSSSRRAIRAIAFVEAFKGVVVLAAATGLLALIHKNLNDLAAQLALLVTAQRGGSAEIKRLLKEITR